MQAAFVAPVLLSVFVLLPPYALLRGIGIIVAQAAASQAAHVASAAGTTPAEGEETGRTVIRELGGLPEATVKVTRDRRTARAVVTGHPLGLKFAPVRATAQRAVSGFVPAGER